MTENKSFEMEAVKNEMGDNIESVEKQTNPKTALTKKQKRRRLVKNILIATLWVIIFEGIGAGLGIAFGANDWYDTLNKSPLTPPGVVFSIIWPVLYCMLAIFGWWNSNNLKDASQKFLFFCFWLQMACNWMWTPVYFFWHEQVIALVLLIITVITVLYMVIDLMYLKEWWPAALLAPYLLWCSFASYLNAYTLAEN